MTDSYTETEAKQCACPQSVNQQSNCVASTCMAWRWSIAKESKAYSKAVIEHAVKAREANPKHNLADSYRDVLLEQGGALERTEGYCGLAGYPHNSLRP